VVTAWMALIAVGPTGCERVGMGLWRGVGLWDAVRMRVRRYGPDQLLRCSPGRGRRGRLAARWPRLADRYSAVLTRQAKATGGRTPPLTVLVFTRPGRGFRRPSVKDDWLGTRLDGMLGRDLVFFRDFSPLLARPTRRMCGRTQSALAVWSRPISSTTSTMTHSPGLNPPPRAGSLRAEPVQAVAKPADPARCRPIRRRGWPARRGTRNNQPLEREIRDSKALAGAGSDSRRSKPRRRRLTSAPNPTEQWRYYKTRCLP